MDTQKLKGKLLERGKTYADCAAHLGISVTSISNKLNDKSILDISEANDLSNFLELTERERIDIFLPTNLHDVQERKGKDV